MVWPEVLVHNSQAVLATREYFPIEILTKGKKISFTYKPHTGLEKVSPREPEYSKETSKNIIINNLQKKCSAKKFL